MRRSFRQYIGTSSFLMQVIVVSEVEPRLGLPSDIAQFSKGRPISACGSKRASEVRLASMSQNRGRLSAAGCCAFP